MSDDDNRVDPRALAPIDQYGESLLYDFSKFLTTLSILALGGVLTITETADASDIKPFNVGLASVTIALAGTLALTTANSIAYGRSTGRSLSKHLDKYVAAAMALLGMGVGSFLFMWLDKLN